MTDEERFQSKVDTCGPVPAHRPELGPCHVWTASKKARAYGCFCLRGKNELAHRVSFYFANGRWPEPCCLHRCDNESCVNPAHLFEGSHQENMADRDLKGRRTPPSGDGHYSRKKPELLARGTRHGSQTKPHRMPRGERHGMSKLTNQDVRDIRANYALCRVTLTELAKRFAVNRTTVASVVRGTSRRSA